MKSLVEKGDFELIDDKFLEDVSDSLKPLVNVQEKYDKTDNDTLLNEYHDSIVGKELGYDLINTSKHGFDCKNSQNGQLLEVKQASFATNWSCTFNDTTEEKAELFQSNSVTLALGVWNGINDLVCIIYGSNIEIGKYLMEKVHHQKKVSQRRTQSISASSLVSKYGFKIKSVSRSIEELECILEQKFSKKWWEGKVE